MGLETFKPTQTAADNAHLLGDTWTPPTREAKVDLNDKNSPVRDNNPPQQTDRTQEKQFTPEQLQQMVKDAGEGKLNETARDSLDQALQKDGIPGLIKAAEDLNKQLEKAGSPYRLSFAGAINQSTGEITIAAALTQPNENHDAILADILKNGTNSQYHERGMTLHKAPTKPAEHSPPPTPGQKV